MVRGSFGDTQDTVIRRKAGAMECDWHAGRVVRTLRNGPTFRAGALFRVVQAAQFASQSIWVVCAPVGPAPFRLWMFRRWELESMRSGRRAVD